MAFSAWGYVLLDDTGLDKHHHRRQYSGNAHGVIAGIGLVTCVYVTTATDQFWLLAYRFCAPEADGKTKLDHVAVMLTQLAPCGITYWAVLLNSWYATTALFKWLLTAGKTFFCPLKSNRSVDDPGGRQPYQPMGCLSWSNEEVEQGKTRKVKGIPKECNLKIFRVLVSTHRTDYLLTNEAKPCDTAAAEHESSIRWMMEQFHRELPRTTAQAPRRRAGRPVPAGPQPAQPAQPRSPGRAGLDPA